MRSEDAPAPERPVPEKENEGVFSCRNMFKMAAATALVGETAALDYRAIESGVASWRNERQAKTPAAPRSHRCRRCLSPASS